MLQILQKYPTIPKETFQRFVDFLTDKMLVGEKVKKNPASINEAGFNSFRS